MKVYISGPMTGLPEFNFPAFHAAEDAVRALGHEPLNPARAMNGETHHPRWAYMRADLKMVCDADAIYQLPDWHKSKGARLEAQVADEIGLRFVTLNDLAMPPSPTP